MLILLYLQRTSYEVQALVSTISIATKHSDGRIRQEHIGSEANKV